MPAFTVTVPHQRGQQDASERLRGFFSKVKEDLGTQVSDLHEEWEDHAVRFGFKTMGLEIKGTMAVEEEEVKIDGQLPFAAMMFKGRIEKEIHDRLAKILA